MGVQRKSRALPAAQPVSVRPLWSPAGCLTNPRSRLPARALGMVRPTLNPICSWAPELELPRSFRKHDFWETRAH